MAPRHVGLGLARCGRVTEVAPAVDHLFRRAAADPELQPAARDDVRRAGVLGHVQRILVAHVDDGRPDLDLVRARADGRKERKRRAELAREMVHAEVRAVGAQFLGGDRELYGLEQRIGRGAYARTVTSRTSARTTGTRSSSTSDVHTPSRNRRLEHEVLKGRRSPLRRHRRKRITSKASYPSNGSIRTVGFPLTLSTVSTRGGPGARGCATAGGARSDSASGGRCSSRSSFISLP